MGAEMTRVKVLNACAIICLAYLAVLPAVHAQTWQSVGKTMAIPVAVAGTACNTASDTVGITADRSALLTCQSGFWVESGGGARYYKFQLAGDIGWFVGLGTIKSSKLTGQVWCDPMVHSYHCGEGGQYRCGSDTACVIAQTRQGYHSANNGRIVAVTALPVISVSDGP